MVDVPNVPGVPSLSSFASDIPEFLVGDVIAPLLINALFGPQWGIFLFGIPIILADNTVTFEVKQDFPISDYQVEAGSFNSYDKVQLPQELRIQVSCGGSEVKRQAFLASIDLQMNTTLLYDVVTPEQVFLNYSFHHKDYRRTAHQGLGLITVDLWMTQIRQSATALFQNTQVPGIAGQQSFGTQQTQTAPPSVEGQVDGLTGTGAGW